MSKLLEKAIDLSVTKHGFEINDGNQEAVKAIVDLCLESIIPAIDEDTGGAPVVSKMTILRVLDGI